MSRTKVFWLALFSVMLLGCCSNIVRCIGKQSKDVDVVPTHYEYRFSPAKKAPTKKPARVSVEEAELSAVIDNLYSMDDYSLSKVGYHGCLQRVHKAFPEVSYREIGAHVEVTYRFCKGLGKRVSMGRVFNVLEQVTFNKSALRRVRQEHRRDPIGHILLEYYHSGCR